MHKLGSVAILLLLALAAGCSQNGTPTAIPDTAVAVSPLPQPTARVSGALVPTFTPQPTFSAPTPDISAASPGSNLPSASPTPVSFDEIIVDVHYAVPALGLDRYLLGNKANQITLVDKTTGVTAEFDNQGGVILELRQALAGTELSAAPESCDACVNLEYELSLESKSGSGWLQDEVLLASLENYLAIGLGPHFPPETVLGLRRSASPYAPSHALALTGDGRLWTWLATDVQITVPPTITTSLAQQLRDGLDQLPLEQVADRYVVDCDGSPVETLLLKSEADQRFVTVLCPEFSLSSTLLPLYLQLDAVLASLVDEVALPRPLAAFPLNALLDYRRADGARMMLFQDGDLVAKGLDGSVITTTWSISQVTSVTSSLLESGELAQGLTTFSVKPSAAITPGVTVEPSLPTSILILRGPEGLYEGEWSERPDSVSLEELDALLNGLIGIELIDETVTPPAGTPEAVVPTPTSAAATATPTRAP